jgi:nicotinamide-nucleotide amidase
LTRPRGFVVVTGSELVRGDRTDLNGPFLAQELRCSASSLHGSRSSATTRSSWTALREGPDADPASSRAGSARRTTTEPSSWSPKPQGAARGRPTLEAEIEGVSRRIAERLRRPYADFEQGVRKQATLPEGAEALGLAGTAPGFVLQCTSTTVVVLPGPPAELKRLWPRALATDAVRRVLERAAAPERRVLRFYGSSESEIARALAEAGGEGDGVVATICARDFEIHVDLMVEPGGESRADDLATALRKRAGHHLFAEDERPVEELVLDACRTQGLTLRPRNRAPAAWWRAAHLGSGSGDAFLGSVVAYADEVKAAELGVPAWCWSGTEPSRPRPPRRWRPGPRRLGAEVAVSVTGIAGHGGGPRRSRSGSCTCGGGPGGSLARELNLPGGREAIRGRATVAALHLLRTLLAQSRHEDT